MTPDANLGFSLIHNDKSLQQYFTQLEREEASPMELRYVAHTAMNREQSFIADISHKKLDYGLLKPFFWSAPYLKKEIIPQEEKLIDLVRKGLEMEANLTIYNFDMVSKFSIRNANPLIQKDTHEKFLLSVTQYEKYKSPYRDIVPFSTNTMPVWVYRPLFPSIFERITTFDGEERKHGQHKSFLTFSAKK